MMRHRTSFIAAVSWVALFAAIGALVLFTANPRARLSERENRLLAGLPEASVESVASGEYMAEIEAFLSDGFYARDRLISASERLLGRFSMLSGDDLYAMQAEDMESLLEADLAERAVEGIPEDGAGEPAVADAAAPLGELEEADDGLGDALDEDLGGAIPLTDTRSYSWLERNDGGKVKLYEYPVDRVRYFAETLKLIKSSLPDDGVVSYAQVPLSSIARRWLNQTEVYGGWGSSAETMLENELAGAEGIRVFNTMEILEPYMRQGTARLFYLTDHHWSAEGAYLVLREMLKAQHLPVVPYEEYSYKAIQGRPNAEGDVDTFNALYPLLPGHSYVVERRTRLKEIDLMNYVTHGYLTFMNNSRYPWRRVITGANTGRKALVICDSFGNAFTPYLLPYYDEVDMCDFRSGRYSKSQAGGSISENIRYFDIDDVYVIVSSANDMRKDDANMNLRESVTP